jgi:hypothetical protein
MTGFTDGREVGLERVADAGEVGTNGFWVDVVAHEYNIKAEGVRGGINGEIV